MKEMRQLLFTGFTFVLIHNSDKHAHACELDALNNTKKKTKQQQQSYQICIHCTSNRNRNKQKHNK